MRHFKFTDMRRHKFNWIWIILLGLFVGSCEDYLDRSPDDGLSEDDVCKDYSRMNIVCLVLKTGSIKGLYITTRDRMVISLEINFLYR